MKNKKYKREGETLIVKEWKYGKKNLMRVTLHDYCGHKLVTIREWFWDPESREHKPGRRGISLPVADFPKALSGLREIRRVLEAGCQS